MSGPRFSAGDALLNRIGLIPAGIALPREGGNDPKGGTEKEFAGLFRE